MAFPVHTGELLEAMGALGVELTTTTVEACALVHPFTVAVTK